MLQNTSKTLGFQKIIVYKTPPGGGKPYLARGLGRFRRARSSKEILGRKICMMLGIVPTIFVNTLLKIFKGSNDIFP